MVTSQVCEQIKIIGLTPFLPTGIHSFTPRVKDIMDITRFVEIESYHLISNSFKFKLIEDSVGRCVWNCLTIPNYNSSTGVCKARYGNPVLPVLRMSSREFSDLPESLNQTDDQFVAEDAFEDCALIGGSPSLFYTKLGADIDNHKVVVRMNYMPSHPSFVTGMFKENLGSVTTHWFLNNYIVTNEPDKVQDLPLATNSTPSYAIVTNQTYAQMLNSSLENSYLKDILYAVTKNRMALTPNPTKHFSGGQSSTWGLISILMPHCKKLTFYGYGDGGNILQYESYITSNLYMYQLSQINPNKFAMRGDPREICSLGCYWQYLKDAIC